MGYLAKQLDLTDAQKAQIKTMMQAQRTTLHPLMQQMEQNHAAMLTATEGGVFEAEKIQALAAQRAQVQAQLDVQHEKLQSEIYNQVLTSEQKTKADQMKQAELARITTRLAATEATAPAEQ
jgi:protein CpxP